MRKRVIDVDNLRIIRRFKLDEPTIASLEMCFWWFDGCDLEVASYNAMPLSNSRVQRVFGLCATEDPYPTEVIIEGIFSETQSGKGVQPSEYRFIPSSVGSDNFVRVGNYRYYLAEFLYSRVNSINGEKGSGGTHKNSHANSHSTNAFCGTVGPAEMAHFEELLAQLTDTELSSLVDAVGITFCFPNEPFDRDVLESVLDEVGRELFYREYRALIEARAR